jgi:hypothetical protein
MAQFSGVAVKDKWTAVTMWTQQRRRRQHGGDRGGGGSEEGIGNFGNLTTNKSKSLLCFSYFNELVNLYKYYQMEKHYILSHKLI